MGRFVVTNASVVLGDRVVADGAVEVEGTRIRRVSSMHDAGERSDARVIDAGGRLLAPGFIDLHIHGAHAHGVDDGVEALRALCGLLPRYGVTGFLPTVTPRPHDAHVRLLSALAQAEVDAGACVLGVHLEGPYLALQGALPPGLDTPPSGADVHALIEAAKPLRAIFSISPEVEGICDVIPLMTGGGAPVFITHTAANVDETRAAIDAGARHATHFYDVFPCPTVVERGVRPCGAVEAILADDRVSVDFILDGTHVDPVAVKLALGCKGPHGVCLTTDAVIGAGLPPGRHRFGGREVVFERAGGPARLADSGGLAGSGLTMDRSLQNAVRILDVDLPQAACMVSTAPARVLGLDRSKGQIAEGFDADMVLLDENLEAVMTWVGGTCVYSSDEQT